MAKFKREALLLSGFLLARATEVRAANDPFAPYLTSLPTVRSPLGETNSGSGASAITTRKFTFGSRNGANTVYAVYAFPQQIGVYPAILLLHGGGGNADTLLPLAEQYAQGGYVSLAIDQPGICGTTNTPNSTGPWKSRPLGEGPRFDVASGPQNSTLVDAEVAGLEAFNWLRSQTNVNPNAIGITGFSWGGYSTTMLSGLLGDRVKAAYAVFGCGFYDKGSFWKDILAALPAADRDVWLTYLDAGRRASNVKAAYFLEGESNDHFFWPEAVGATVDAVLGTKNHVWGPNLNHMQLPAGPSMQRLYFDHYLKGMGPSFADVSVSGIEPQNDGTKKITILIGAPAGLSIASAQLYYSEKGPSWETRTWTAADARLQSPGTYVAALPADPVGKRWDFYAFATDTRMFSTSTSMFDSTSTIPMLGVDGGDVGADAGATSDASASDTGELDSSAFEAASNSGSDVEAGTASTASGSNDSADGSSASGGSGSGRASASPVAGQSGTGRSGCTCGSAANRASGWALGAVALALVSVTRRLSIRVKKRG